MEWWVEVDSAESIWIINGTHLAYNKRKSTKLVYGGNFIYICQFSLQTGFDSLWILHSVMDVINDWKMSLAFPTNMKTLHSVAYTYSFYNFNFINYYNSTIM